MAGLVHGSLVVMSDTVLLDAWPAIVASTTSIVVASCLWPTVSPDSLHGAVESSLGTRCDQRHDFDDYHPRPFGCLDSSFPTEAC